MQSRDARCHTAAAPESSRKVAAFKRLFDSVGFPTKKTRREVFYLEKDDGFSRTNSRYEESRTLWRICEIKITRAKVNRTDVMLAGSVTFFVYESDT